jgi:hypothetical protein
MTDEDPARPDADRHPESVPRHSDGADREETPPAPGIEFEDPDVSPLAAALGQAGVYMAVAAVGAAALGVVLGALDAGVATRVAFLLALALGTVGMVLAAVFQASAAGLSLRD